MLAALFNEPPNFYVFIGFSLFCGTSIFLWISRLPKASAFYKRSWGLEIPWEDFGLLLFTCILAAFLALTCLGQIYKILNPDELEQSILGTYGLHGAILVSILLLRWKVPGLYGESLNRPYKMRTASLLLVTTAHFIKFLPLLWLVFLLLAAFFQKIGHEPAPQRLVELMRQAADHRPMHFAGLAFGAIIMAPLAEETLFRGYIHRFLRAKTGLPAAALANSLLFAAIHVNIASFVPLFILSLLLTYVYEKTGSLLAPIIFHALFNAFTVGAILIHDHLPEFNF